MSIQDYEYFLEPGEREYQPCGESDYIFVRWADRPVDLVIDNETVTLEKGAEYEAKGARFTSFVIKNTDPDNAAVVRLAVGTDRFRTRIVAGNITTTPGLMTGTGEVIPDTRKNITVQAISVAGTGITENAWDIVGNLMSGSLPWRFKINDGNSTFEDPMSHGLEYNPDLHSGVLVFGHTTGNSPWLIEIDPINGTLLKDWGPISDLGQPAAVTRIGSTLFQVNTFGSEGVYRKVSGGAWNLIYANSGLRDEITADKDGYLYVVEGSDLVKINQSGQEQARATVGAVSSIAWHQGEMWLFGDGNYKGRVYNTDLENTYTSAVYMRDNYGTVIYNGYAYCLVDDFPDYPIEVRALYTVSGQLAGRAYLACSNPWLGKRPDKLESVRTTADVTVTDADTGSPTVTGELIKLVFEWYTGNPAPDDYMDLVHGVAITGGTNIEGFSYPPVQIRSDGQTLLAAKIPDDFTQIFPLTIQLTVDARISAYE